MVIDLSFFKVLRMLRAFRALRMLSNLPRLRIVIRAIGSTFGQQFLNVLMVSGIFWSIFSIIGVSLFSSQMWHCETPAGAILYNTTELKTPCDQLGGMWVNHDQHFDNFINAIMFVYQIATLEMWPQMMKKVADSSPHGAMLDYNKLPASIMFVFSIIFCSYFVFGLLIGVIVDRYNKQHEKFTGALDLSEARRHYLQAYKVHARVCTHHHHQHHQHHQHHHPPPPPP